MSQSPKISVIIPTHNRANSLIRAMSSVFNQSILPLEVIVVDDGSTDDTSTMIHQLFPTAKYIYQAQAGVSAARNCGIRNAQGQWIALLDSDDEWMPLKLEQQLDYLKLYPDLMLCHTDELWFRNGVRVNPMKKHKKCGGSIFQHCLDICHIAPSSTLIRYEAFNIVGLFDEEMPVCEDYDLWLKIASRWPIHYIDKPLVKRYAGHKDQLSCQYWGMDRFRIQALENILKADKLSTTNRNATLHVLSKKVKIYLNGARKRGKNEETPHYEKILLMCETEIQPLQM
jgi:glycosyltransferase involved in cell wall biosynthesis